MSWLGYNRNQLISKEDCHTCIEVCEQVYLYVKLCLLGCQSAIWLISLAVAVIQFYALSYSSFILVTSAALY